MKKSVIILIIADVILTANVALWTGLALDLSNGITAINYVFLVLTCFIPAIYIVFASRKSLDASLNEVLMPSFITTSLYFLANLIATALLLAFSHKSYLPTIITEVVLTSIYAFIMCLCMVATSHIRDTYKKKNYKEEK